MSAALAIVTSNIQTWFVKQAMTGLVGELEALVETGSADVSEPDDRPCGRDRGADRPGLGVSAPLPVRDGLVDLAAQWQMRGRHGVEQGDPPVQVRHGAAAER